MCTNFTQSKFQNQIFILVSSKIKTRWYVIFKDSFCSTSKFCWKGSLTGLHQAWWSSCHVHQHYPPEWIHPQSSWVWTTSQWRWSTVSVIHQMQFCTLKLNLSLCENTWIDHTLCNTGVHEYTRQIAYLIKLIVYFASINTLWQQSLDRIPWHFFWRKIGTSLKIIAYTTSMYEDIFLKIGQAATCM